MTRDERTERGSIDPTRTTRLSEAIRLTRPLVPEIVSLIERVLGGDDTAEDALTAAALAAYDEACEAVAGVGLEFRHRGVEYTVMDVPGQGSGLRLDVEFALAAPLDYPDTLLWWDRRFYIGFGAQAAEQILLDYARRYWLCDKLRLPTEAEARRLDGIECVRLAHGADPPTGTRL